MSALVSFGFGAATTAIITFGAVFLVGRLRRVDLTRESSGCTEISTDRLGQIATDELTYLADQFHVLTVSMYTELCTRRTADLATSELAAMRRDEGGG